MATSSSQAMTRSRWKKIVTSFYRSLLFFWHHSENWVFLKTVSFHFQSIKWTLTLPWCKTLAWKISNTCSLGAIFKKILFEWKWLLIGLRGFIDRFWQNKFPLKSRYGVQTRLRALLEPAKTQLPIVKNSKHEESISISSLVTRGYGIFEPKALK